MMKVVDGIFLFPMRKLLPTIAIFLSATTTSRQKWMDFAVGQGNIPVGDRKFQFGDGKVLIRDRNFELPDVKNCGR
jgi:hypothetical protein